MINNYFYYITISNGGLYSYNFKRKKVITNPCVHLPMPLQSAFLFTHIPSELGRWGRFSTTYESDRLDEPSYVADLLDSLYDELVLMRANGGLLFPHVSSFKLSGVNWYDQTDKQKIINWYNSYCRERNKRPKQALGECTITKEFREYLRTI